VLLATQLAGHGAAVTPIDADPNKPLSRWAKLPGKPNNLTVVADVTENSIIDSVEAQGRKISKEQRSNISVGKSRIISTHKRSGRSAAW